MADALRVVEYPILHVVHALPHRAGPLRGQCNADDSEIAEWCAQTEHVLVTADSDFRGRWARSGLLADHGVEVIVFDRDIPGLQPQHHEVTRHLDAWQTDLSRQPYGHRVWDQSLRIVRPRIRVGKRLPPRSRAVVTPVDTSHPSAPPPSGDQK